MVTFLCYNFIEYIHSHFFSPRLPSASSNKAAAFSSPSKSPEKNDQQSPPQFLEPTQNLEILADKNFSYLTVDEKYFSPNELAYYKDKYPSPTRKASPKIRWKPGDFLGQGSFGTVVMGFNAVTGEIMAVKQVNLEGNESNDKVLSLQSEIELLMQFEHPNIVRYLGTSRTNKKLNIFLEYISGGSIAFLLKKYGKFNESIVRQYTLQILKGLEYLHWNKVLHRDIKGANVLVDNKGVCKLADFGSSKRMTELWNTEQNTLTGTANWMAPEVVRQSMVSRYSDIWSLGCTVIEMITGKPPWSEFNNALTTMFNIAKTNEPPKLPDNLSPDLIDFLQNCLKIIPGERANCRQLLVHIFISGKQSMFQEVDSQSPQIRRKLPEKEQDFFEIKLRESSNIKNPEMNWGHQDHNAINNNAVVFQLNDQNKNANNRKSEERKNSQGNFDPFLVKLNSRNSMPSNNFQDDSPKNQEKKGDDVSNDNKGTSKKIFKKKSYEFFGIQNHGHGESQSQSHSQSKEKINLVDERFDKDGEMKNSDTKIKYQLSKKNSNEHHAVGNSGFRESDRELIEEHKLNGNDLRF